MVFRFLFQCNVLANVVFIVNDLLETVIVSDTLDDFRPNHFEAHPIVQAKDK